MPWERLLLTATERGRIDQLTLAGMSTRAIAAKLGCSQSIVTRYGKDARARFVAENPSCRCGKPIFHRGRCRLAPELIASIDRMARDGVGIRAIGRQLSLGETVVTRYTRDALTEERASGRRCACGLPFAHEGTCPGPRGSSHDVKHGGAIRRLLEAGRLRADIAKQLDLDGNVVERIARPMLDEMAADGVTCDCGQPINHRGGCIARMRLVPASPDKTYRWKHARRAGLDLTTRKQIRALVRTGLGAAKIARRLGLSRNKIAAVEKDLMALGEAMPSKCPCGQPRDHGGRCSRLPQERKPAPTARKPRMPAAVIEEIRRRAAGGESAQSIAKETGVPVQSALAHIRRWVADQGDALPPCACGRPARHAGGCVVNVSGALTRREEAYIEARLREGVTVADVARETGISFHTVLGRAWPIFDGLSEAGVYCGCGQRRGHKGTCAATWTSGGRMRGPRPIETEVQQRIVNLLLLGDVLADVRHKAKVSRRIVLRVLGTMTEQERRRRTQALRRRIGDVDARLHSAAIFERIGRAIPKSADASVRDDTVAELYLAVLQGQLREDRIEAAAKTYLGRAYGEWQSAFGPRSLDETFGADGRRTLGDMLEDDTAAAHIEQMEIGS